MQFKSLLNIETSFKQIRIFSIIFVGCCTIITCYVTYKAYHFAEVQRHKIYVLDNGKSLMLALSQDETINRPVEAREHVRRFHELLFSLAPEKAAIESNIKRALLLSDKSVYDYYKNLSETGYYNQVIAGNIIQQVQIDSVVCNFNIYPYDAVCYAKQIILRPSNMTLRSLITHCTLFNCARSDDNPQGFLIEKFEVLQNNDLQTVKR